MSLCAVLQQWCSLLSLRHFQRLDFSFSRLCLKIPGDVMSERFNQCALSSAAVQSHHMPSHSTLKVSSCWALMSRWSLCRMIKSILWASLLNSALKSVLLRVVFHWAVDDMCKGDSRMTRHSQRFWIPSLKLQLIVVFLLEIWNNLCNKIWLLK